MKIHSKNSTLFWFTVCRSANQSHTVWTWSSSYILTAKCQNATAYGDAFTAKQTATSYIILGLLMTMATPRDRCCCLLTSPWPWNNARCTEFKDDDSNYVQKMNDVCVELTAFNDLRWNETSGLRHAHKKHTWNSFYFEKPKHCW